jgi:mannose-6-phosphate isomerase class I
VTYDPEPSYPLERGFIERGYRALAERCRTAGGVIAVDGPAALDWDALARGLAHAGRIHRVGVVDAGLVPALPGDPVFARLYDGPLAELVQLPALEPAGGGRPSIVLGRGSALAPHDVLCYADVPKRDQLARAGGGKTEQRLLFVDWPAEERHARELAGQIDVYVDLANAAEPRFVDGDVLRSALARVAAGPFRTRPAFLPGPWGGQWLRGRLGIETGEPNLAWSYELIAPEASLLLHDGDRSRIEVAFELLLGACADVVLGRDVAGRFEGRLPIRFDYLDTLDGGHLSIQCHPSNDYMRATFGGTYTQDESYYVVETSPGAEIFLGLRDGADLDAFEKAARAALDGKPFDPGLFLQTQPAEQHRLYLIPGGTPHASGAGNVVLEISATPYLYTLRFYDWLRRNLDGELRPVHLEHAFANLDPSRRGSVVHDLLVQEPRQLRAGDGWCELVLGVLPELFFAVHRLDFAAAVADETADRFHLLNLVAGGSVAIETESGRRHALSYAETIVVPAATGAYELTNLGRSECKVVKAFVR